MDKKKNKKNRPKAKFLSRRNSKVAGFRISTSTADSILFPAGKAGLIFFVPVFCRLSKRQNLAFFPEFDDSTLVLSHSLLSSAWQAKE